MGNRFYKQESEPEIMRMVESLANQILKSAVIRARDSSSDIQIQLFQTLLNNETLLTQAIEALINRVHNKQKQALDEFNNLYEMK